MSAPNGMLFFRHFRAFFVSASEKYVWIATKLLSLLFVKEKTN